jgi:hypothetical protein
MAYIRTDQKQATITIGKKWDKGAIYIGRGSPLGNPFVMENTSQEERDRVCDLYKEWFDNKIQNSDNGVMNELRKIYALAKVQPVTLGCFCTPKRCHGETIKSFLDQHLT